MRLTPQLVQVIHVSLLPQYWACNQRRVSTESSLCWCIEYRPQATENNPCGTYMRQLRKEKRDKERRVICCVLAADIAKDYLHSWITSLFILPFCFSLQSIHQQPFLTVTSRPPPLWMTLPAQAFPTQTRALARRATWPDLWMALRWVWGLALAWWGERQTETETWRELEWEGAEGLICCAACLMWQGHRRAFWILHTTPVPHPIPAKHRLPPLPASAKQTKASMSRWDCIIATCRCK